ncbi:hypothetical protein SLS55_010560 [Diplodia seriata]|uniref:Uncharacterized protein n=1 Tax=Diplodia seriata TaxID=420778 RepID=A0ABR3BXI8_9PEZI
MSRLEKGRVGIRGGRCTVATREVFASDAPANLQKPLRAQTLRDLSPTHPILPNIAAMPATPSDPVASTTTVSAIQPPDVTADDAMRPADAHPDPASASSEPEIWRLADIVMKRGSVPCDDPRLQLSVINFKSAIDRQEEELKRLKADLIHYRSVYDDLKRVSERIPEKEAQLQKRVKDLEAENRNLMWRLEDENRKLEWMLQQLAPAAHKIQLQKEQIELQEKQIEQQTERNEQQATQIKQQTTWNEQQATQIKQQHTQIEQQTTRIKQQDTQIATQATWNGQQATKIEQQNTQIEKQAARLEQQKLHVKDLQTELEQLKRRLEQEKAERREDKDRVKQTLERTLRAETHPADGQPTSRRIFKKPDHLGPEKNQDLPDYSRGYRERLPERPYDRRRSLSPVRSPPDRYARERRTSPPRASTYRPDYEPIRRLRGDEPANIDHSKPPPRHPSSYSSVASKPMLGIHKVERSEHGLLLYLLE